MPERTGAHCLYDRFAAAVRRQITIAISGSLRKKLATNATYRSPRNRHPAPNAPAVTVPQTDEGISALGRAAPDRG